jgi:hypothetical protein
MSLSYEPFQRSLAEVFFEVVFLLVDLLDEAAFFCDGFRAGAFFEVVFFVVVFLFEGFRAGAFFVVDFFEVDLLVVDFLEGLRAGAFLVVDFFDVVFFEEDFLEVVRFVVEVLVLLVLRAGAFLAAGFFVVFLVVDDLALVFFFEDLRAGALAVFFLDVVRLAAVFLATACSSRGRHLRLSL